MTYTTSKTSVFGVFLRFKHTIELKVANKVANARQVYFPFMSEVSLRKVIFIVTSKILFEWHKATNEMI